MPCPFLTLNISHEATQAEARAAYVSALRTAHPDTGGSLEKATELGEAALLIKQGKGFSRCDCKRDKVRGFTINISDFEDMMRAAYAAHDANYEAKQKRARRSRPEPPPRPVSYRPEPPPRPVSYRPEPPPRKKGPRPAKKPPEPVRPGVPIYEVSPDTFTDAVKDMFKAKRK